jgi:hypothetical protein
MLVATLGLVVLVVVSAGKIQDRAGAQQVLPGLVSRRTQAGTVRWWRWRVLWAAGA